MLRRRRLAGAVVDATFGAIAAAPPPLLLLLSVAVLLLLLLLALACAVLPALLLQRLALAPPLGGGRRRSLPPNRCGCSVIAMDAATALIRARRDAQIAQRDALSFAFVNVHTLHGQPIRATSLLPAALDVNRIESIDESSTLSKKKVARG